MLYYFCGNNSRHAELEFLSDELYVLGHAKKQT